jgi:hypothetical protein
MIYLVLLAVNVLLLFFIRSEKKYAWICISIWLLLIISFIYWMIASSHVEKIYWSGEEMLKTMNGFKRFNHRFFHCISFQTLLTLIFQIVGYKKTRFPNFYKWTYFIFLALLILNSILEVMLTIVPNGL